MLVHELMTAPPVTVPHSLPRPDAAHLMRSQGILSVTDVLPDYATPARVGV